MRYLIQGGVLGGIVLFIWSAISWMALPFHDQHLKGFTNETLVESALMASLEKEAGGVYILPNPMSPAHLTAEANQRAQQKMQSGPFALVVMNPKGGGSMPQNMALALVIQILGAALVTGLLLKTGGMKYWGRVGFVVLFGIAAGVVCWLPQWNWWGFSAGFVLTELMDLLVGWFLAGLVIAKVTK
jgi:hypothetical protein